MRTFIAIEINPELKDRLVHERERLRRQLAGARIRWVQPQGMHLTLKFLGEIEAGRVEAIAAQMELLAGRYAPFAIRLQSLGAFPNLRRPRVLWVGVQAPPVLAALRADLERCLEGLGFVRERRPFHPHITLGRVRDSGGDRVDWAAALAIGAQEPLGEQRVEALALFRSELRPTGAVYTCLSAAPLRGHHET